MSEIIRNMNTNLFMLIVIASTMVLSWAMTMVITKGGKWND